MPGTASGGTPSGKPPRASATVRATTKNRNPKTNPANNLTCGPTVAIARACDKADEWAKGGIVIGDDERLIPRWHPHQLRHNAATTLRKDFGIEVSRIALGHTTADMTEQYAEVDREKIKQIMGQVG